MAIEKFIGSVERGMSGDRFAVKKDPITGPVSGSGNETSNTGKTADEVRVEEHAKETGLPPGIAAPTKGRGSQPIG